MGTILMYSRSMAAVLKPWVDTDLSPGLSLADLAPGIVARVIHVASAEEGASAELALRLAELGFLPGELVRIVARGFLSREPLAVRVGTGTFALRRFEAAAIRVAPEPAPQG
jgi:ferrous iron transport protein A